jgi:hypothetical protein
MPVTYTNYKGDRYILYKKETIYGTFQYYFAKSSDKGIPCRAIPDGYEIRESVNGRVSLAKIRPVLLSAAEIQIVANLLDNHPQSEAYRLAVKANRIEIFEHVGPNPNQVIETFERAGMSVRGKKRQRLEETLSRQGRYEAVLRFILVSKTERTFRVERISYLSGIDDWIQIGPVSGLADLAHEIIPLLGTDEFFEFL